MVTPDCTAMQNGHCWHLQNLQWLLARVCLQKSAHVLNVKSPRRPDWHATFSGSAAAVANGRRADSKAAWRRREAGGFGRRCQSSRFADVIPRTHDEERAVWRGASHILVNLALLLDTDG